MTGYLRRTPLGDEFHGECGTAVEIFSDEGDDSLWGGIANYEAASLMSGGRGDDRLETIDPPGWIQDGVPGHDASSALRRNVELRGGGRVFVGHWEDVDDELDYRVDFHPASPPDWLSEELVVPDRD